MKESCGLCGEIGKTKYYADGQILTRCDKHEGLYLQWHKTVVSKL